MAEEKTQENSTEKLIERDVAITPDTPPAKERSKNDAAITQNKPPVRERTPRKPKLQVPRSGAKEKKQDHSEYIDRIHNMASAKPLDKQSGKLPEKYNPEPPKWTKK